LIHFSFIILILQLQFNHFCSVSFYYFILLYLIFFHPNCWTIFTKTIAYLYSLSLDFLVVLNQFFRSQMNLKKMIQILIHDQFFILILNNFFLLLFQYQWSNNFYSFFFYKMFILLWWEFDVLLKHLIVIFHLFEFSSIFSFIVQTKFLAS